MDSLLFYFHEMNEDSSRTFGAEFDFSENLVGCVFSRYGAGRRSLESSVWNSVLRAHVTGVHDAEPSGLLRATLATSTSHHLPLRSSALQLLLVRSTV